MMDRNFSFSFHSAFLATMEKNGADAVLVGAVNIFSDVCVKECLFDRGSRCVKECILQNRKCHV